MDDLKQLYTEKNQHLLTFFEEVKAFDFYRDIFPVGTFERQGCFEDGKPNGLALVIEGKGKAFHYTVTDELEQLSDLQMKNFVVMSPISYFGARRTAQNARYLYALTFDLDGVGMPQLRDLLFQMKNDVTPRATYIVNSGTGFHLYYVLETPFPLYPQNQRYLKELKYALTRQIWNRYTSTIKEPQVQGIVQGFRIVGSPSKMGVDYPVTAFQHGGRVTLDYLFGFVPTTSGELEKIEKALKRSTMSLEAAKKKYPEWYDRRVVRKEGRGHWTVKRDLYDWWLRRISSEIKVGHRFYGIMTLAIYANKCAIAEDELWRDAFSLLAGYDAMSDEATNRFTEVDVISALEFFHEDYLRFPRDDIAKYTGLPMTANKRNGRPQELHLKIARSTRDIVHENWREGNGRPNKSQLVEAYMIANPEEKNKSAIARGAGVNRDTVAKYYDEIAIKLW